MSLLINKDEIVKIAISAKNFDKALIKDSVIEIVQENYLRPLIGDELFTELMTQAVIDVANLSTKNQALVEQFKPALAYNILLLCIPTMMMNIVSAGIQVNNTEYSQSGTDKQRADVAETIREIGRMQKEKFLRWLKINKADYPLFINFINHISRNCRSEQWWSNDLIFFFDVENNNENNASVISGIIL